jgi:hypothetical protein
MRVVVVLGGLAALGLAAFMLTMGRTPSTASQASVGTIKPLHPVRKPGTHGTLVKPGVKPKVVPAPTHAKPKPKTPPKKAAPKPITLLPGLPPEVAAALRKDELVVVSLYDPQARVDRISLAEAAAGAKVSHAGFVPLSVLRQRQAGPLMWQLGVLPDPSVLVYARPGKLVARFDGFADRDTIAQAVVNAAAATP